MRLFFYGTLLDPDVLALVLGRTVSLSTARLDGWRRVQARGRSFPIILRQPGASVDGAATGPLPAADLARLRAYEGPDYGLLRCRPVLADGHAVAAGVFRPSGRLLPGAADWTLGDWQAAAKARYIAALRREIRHG